MLYISINKYDVYDIKVYNKNYFEKRKKNKLCIILKIKLNLYLKYIIYNFYL